MSGLPKQEERERRRLEQRVEECAWALSGELQTELWSRDYGHTWGNRNEFTSVIMKHRELLDLPLPKAADLLLKNLPEWDANLAAKEAKAKSRYISPMQIRETEEYVARLRAAIVERIPIGPPEESVCVCSLDAAKVPGLRPGIWTVFSGNHLLGVADTKDDAIQCARAAAERFRSFRVALTDSNLRPA